MNPIRQPPKRNYYGAYDHTRDRSSFARRADFGALVPLCPRTAGFRDVVLGFLGLLGWPKLYVGVVSYGILQTFGLPSMLPELQNSFRNPEP